MLSMLASGVITQVASIDRRGRLDCCSQELLGHRFPSGEPR